MRSKRTSVAPRAEAKDASSSDLPVPPKADGEDFKAKFQQWQDTSSASNREAKPFTVAEGQMGKLAGASLPTVLTALAGAFAPGYKGSLKKKEEGGEATYVLPVSLAGYEWEEKEAPVQYNQPDLPIEIYEFQGCPFCRKVRVAVSALGLDVLFRPCPKDGQVWRPEAIAKGGKSQFPYMVDPNTGTAMYESKDIIDYLFKNYGPGEVPRGLSLRNSTIANSLGMMGRMGAGSRAKASTQPPQPLDLWGYEASPFVGLVKEVLCELEIPYVQHSTPRGSAKRQELFERKGQFQVPFLEDRNTGAELFESSSIIDYLNFVYGA